jgi:hypothetical protein
LTDWTVTLYKLFLGDQATTPPYFYQRGYTIHSIEAAIFPNGGSWNFGLNGWVTTNNATAFSGYIFDKGDVILDQHEQYFTVINVHKWPVGSTLKFIVYELERMDIFPFLSGYFGFEDETHGTIGYMFEESFERGTFAL